MLTGGDQVGDGSARIAAGDQTFADQHRIGACAGVGQQVGPAPDTGLSDTDHVGRQPGSNAREAVSIDPQRP